MNIQKLSQRPTVFERIFGISPQQFKELAAELEPIWQEAERKRKTDKKRERMIGAGRKYVLSFDQSLAMHLLYMRTYAPYIFIGVVFCIDDGSVTRYFQKVRPLLAARMKKIAIKQIPISQKEILDLIADATEQEAKGETGLDIQERKRGTPSRRRLL
ncbi:MAG: hypothetical protein A3E07_02840 [Candidatus Wildermuthbacteria bacterium RIFCSPHIGHO2_12_FULL_45_9]|nr:MAG: hypothetical protein A3E07_02840 [Candidatus Wildermuthbacteria bacterium RIFCSPHIGHO2_12_FULL_45_9]